ncbi:MAG: ABC transporter ATP-binding protein, partial [Planctomycetota bacterium]
WDHLGELGASSGLTTWWTTHLMDEAERADRLAVMSGGRVLATQTPDELRSTLGGHVVVVEPGEGLAVESVREAVTAELGPWDAGRGPVASDDGEVRFEHADGPAVVAKVAGMWPGRLRRVSVGRPTLEDAYLRLTAGATGAGDD